MDYDNYVLVLSCCQDGIVLGYGLVSIQSIGPSKEMSVV